jgi:hypothetical protein
MDPSECVGGHCSTPTCALSCASGFKCSGPTAGTCH